MAYSGVGTAAQLLLTNAGATAPTWVTLSGDMAVSATGTGSVVSITGAAGVINVAATGNVITWAKATASPGLNQSAQTTDTATNNITVASQAGAAGASGTNKIGGNIILMSPAASNSGTVTGQVILGAGGANQMMVSAAGLVQGASEGMVWLGNGAIAAPTGSNYSMRSDGSTVTALNVPTGGQIAFRVNNSTKVLMTTANFGPSADNAVTLGVGGQAWSNITSYILSLGATPSTTGSIRLTNNTGINVRNALNSADISAFLVDESNNIYIGDGTNNGNIILNPGNSNINFFASGANQAFFNGTVFELIVPTLTWAATTTSPTITQASEGTVTQGQDLTITPQQSTHTTDQGGGSLIVSLQTPAGAGTFPGLRVKGGTNLFASIQSYTTSSSFGAFYLGSYNANLTPGSTNYTLVNDNTTTSLNASGTTVALTVAGATTVLSSTASAMTLGASTSITLTPPTLQWATGVTAPTITQASESTAIKGQDLAITPQQSTHTTDQGGGNLKLTFQAPTGTGAEAGLEVFRGATIQAAIQPFNAGAGLGVAGTILLNNAALSSTNWMAQGAGGLLFLNAATEIGMGVNGTLGTSLDIDTNGLHVFARAQGLGGGTGVIALANASVVPTSASSGGLIVYSNSGALETYASAIQFNSLQASPTITQPSESTATKGQDLTITPQQSTHTTDQGGGNLIVSLQTPAGAGVEASLQVKQGGTTIADIGAYPAQPTIGILHLGSAAKSTTNFVIYSDGSTTVMNGGTSLQFGSGGTVSAIYNSSGYAQDGAFPTGGLDNRPYAWKATSGAISTATNITLSNAQKQTPIIQLNDTVQGGGCTITLPNTVGGFWYFDLTGVTFGGNNLIFTTGSGTSATVSSIGLTGQFLLTVAIVASNFVSAGGA